MNDAIRITSPADPVETVGNSLKSAQKRGGVQTLERDDTSSLDAMWVAFQSAASPEAEKPSNPLTNPQISLYGSYYGTLIPNTESGEGVVSSGDPVQVLDYYPYGAERISTGSFEEEHKFAQTRRDEETNLDYAQNRYLENTRGQFISQDAVFWEVGITADGEGVLFDPQLQNAYSYAKNNPRYGKITIRFKRKKILQRTTVTFGDSWNSYFPGNERFLVPTPASRPHFTSADAGPAVDPGKSGIPERDPLDLPDSAMPPVRERASGTSVQYYEAQYHGGVGRDDIESIHIQQSDWDTDPKIREVVETFQKNNPDSEIKIVIY